MSEHLSRRELHAPDRFQARAGTFLEWAGAHPREIVIGGVALLVAIGIAGVIFGGGLKRSVPGGSELTAAMAMADRPVQATPDEKPQPGQEPPFASQKDKEEAVLKALTDVRTGHAGSAAAVQALLPMAGAEMFLGKTDEALQHYEGYLKEAPMDSPMRFLAYEGKGDLLLVKGDGAAALGTFDAMAKELPGYGDFAAYGRGRALAAQGKFVDAITSLRAVKNWKGGSRLSSDAAGREATLSLEHPDAATVVDAAEKAEADKAAAAAAAAPPAGAKPADAKPAATATP